jgi:hypothetical protein
MLRMCTAMALSVIACMKGVWKVRYHNFMWENFWSHHYDTTQQSRHIFILFFNILALPIQAFLPLCNRTIHTLVVNVWFNSRSQPCTSCWKSTSVLKCLPERRCLKAQTKGGRVDAPTCHTDCIATIQMCLQQWKEWHCHAATTTPCVKSPGHCWWISDFSFSIVSQ